MIKQILTKVLVVSLLLSGGAAWAEKSIHETLTDKGLKKVEKEDEARLGQMQINPMMMEIYMADGSTVEKNQMMQLFMGGKHTPDLYIDANDKPVAMVMRDATPEEQAEMKAQMEAQMAARNAPSNLKGNPAPDFSVEDISGKKYSLAELKDKVIVLNFWFIQCQPCVMEMPELNKLVEEYKGKDVVFLAISGMDSKEAIEEFLTEKEFNYNIVASGGQVAQKYGVRGFPTSIIIDKKGVVVAEHSGFAPGLKETLSKEIKAAM